MNTRIDKTVNEKHNVCPICELTFPEWSLYAHHKLNPCIRKIKPIRTTNRTKQEIVKELEQNIIAIWPNAFIGWAC